MPESVALLVAFLICQHCAHRGVVVDFALEPGGTDEPVDALLDEPDEVVFGCVPFAAGAVCFPAPRRKLPMTSSHLENQEFL
jgi:hypothetical protein